MTEGEDQLLNLFDMAAIETVKSAVRAQSSMTMFRHACFWRFASKGLLAEQHSVDAGGTS